MSSRSQVDAPPIAANADMDAKVKEYLDTQLKAVSAGGGNSQSPDSSAKSFFPPLTSASSIFSMVLVFIFMLVLFTKKYARYVYDYGKSEIKRYLAYAWNLITANEGFAQIPSSQIPSSQTPPSTAAQSVGVNRTVSDALNNASKIVSEADSYINAMPAAIAKQTPVHHSGAKQKQPPASTESSMERDRDIALATSFADTDEIAQQVMEPVQNVVDQVASATGAAATKIKPISNVSKNTARKKSSSK